MSEVTISREEAVAMIKKCRKFFSVTFIKRKDGSKRRMICRNGVKKHLVKSENKKERNFDPANHDLIRTYSMDSQGYRNIGIEGIRVVKMNKITYNVVDND
jgi:hypothetical protein